MLRTRLSIFAVLLITAAASCALANDALNSPVKINISAYGSNQKSKRGLFSTDFIVPLYYPDQKDSLVFFNPKHTYTTPFANEINQGLGLRHIFKDSFILGLNFFFDRRLAHSNKWYSQSGIGLEYLSRPLDVRLNWYKPLTKYKVVDTSYGFGQTSLIQYDSKEEPLQGLDFELGAPILDKYTKTRAYAGGFFYQSRLSKNVNGFRFRTETSLTNWFNLDTIVNTKAGGKVEFIGGIRFTVPLEWGSLFKRKSKQNAPVPANTYIQERIFERVVRDIDIQSKSSSAPSKKHDMTYVDNSNATGIEDGSFEHPYNTIQEGVDSATGDKWVYVREGSGAYGGGVVVEDGITLWGSGYNGGFNGITATDYPVVDGPGDGNVIQLADNNKLMGLQMQGGIDAVYGYGVSGTEILNNKIINCNDAGIYLTYPMSSTASGITISNNTISDNLASGITIMHAGVGSLSNFTLEFR